MASLLASADLAPSPCALWGLPPFVGSGHVGREGGGHVTLTLPVPQAPDWVDAEECHRCRVQFGVVTRKVSVPPGAAPRPPAVAVRPLHPLEVLSLLAVTSWCGGGQVHPQPCGHRGHRGVLSLMACAVGGSLGEAASPRGQECRGLGAAGGSGVCFPGLLRP